MAGTIKTSISVTIENGNFKDRIAPGQQSVVQTTAGKGGGIQAIGTAEETIAFGEVSGGGYIFLQNLDATNFITYGPQVGTGDGQLGLTLKAGEIAWFRITSASVWRAKADTASCDLDVRLYED